MSNILFWGKPPKKRTTEEWQNHYQADGAPPGCYVPNMEKEYAERWRAKIVGTRSGNPQIEIRRQKHANMVIVVAGPKGYKAKYGFIEQPHAVQVSMNSPEVFTPTEFNEFFIAVKEAQAILEDYWKDPQGTLERIKELQGA